MNSQAHGVWIAELGELYATRKAESEAVNSFIEVRRYLRVAYGRRTASFPRQCVFYGLRMKLYFSEIDGNRRFWPVNGGPHDKSFKDFTEAEVAQVGPRLIICEEQEKACIWTKIWKQKPLRHSQRIPRSLKVGLVREYLMLCCREPIVWICMNAGFLESDEPLSQVQCRYKVCVLRYGAKCLKETQRTLIV